MPTSEIARLVEGASQALCDILQPSYGFLDQPIRSEIFGHQRFAQHGRSLGLTHRQTQLHTGRQTFTPRLRSNITRLRAAYSYIGSQAMAGYDISPAAEWLLENFHLLEAQFKEVYEGLPPSFFRALPRLVEPPLEGLPRIYGVAWAFVAHTDGAFDEALLVHFLQAYQESCELKLSELWALPNTLRVVLMENLRRLAERVAGNKAARELANLCSDHIEDYTLGTLDTLLQLLNQRGVGRVFLAQMAQRLRDKQSSIHAPYQAWLHSAMPDFAAVQTQIRADQAADNLSVSNAVTSLRAIGDADWSDVVAQTSVLVRMLLAAPVFEAEHSTTRDITLHAIERLSKRLGRSETAIAQVLLGCMASGAVLGSGVGLLGTVPSYWLEGAGRGALLRALQAPEGWAERVQQWFRRWAFGVYQTSILGIALATLLGLLSHRYGHMGAWPLLLGSLAMVFPVTATVIALLNRLVSELIRPAHLHRLAFAQGIGPQHRVLVVIPCLLTSDATVEQLVHQLHLHYLANPELQAQFALLSDWADADQAQQISDAPLLGKAVELLTLLNHRYAQPGPIARFVLLHRGRSYSPTQQCWMGWERKRGKLEMLINAMAAPTDNGYFMDLGTLSRIAPQTPYVLTLDCDTVLPPGRLRELVGVAAHPYNQPQLDPLGQHVQSGYSILQPRIVTPLPVAALHTRYHTLFAGQIGVDPYNAASSEVYQDLFAEGTFTGKGLLHVQAMQSVLHNRLPEEQILSHDLLEGALARCATVSDVALVEDVPYHADVAAARLHRWMRGDWQLLPFVLHAKRYGIGRIHRWKMIDNLRRSLVAPMSWLLLMLALSGHFITPALALGWVVAAYLSGPLLGALAGFFPNRRSLALWRFYAQAGRDVLRDVSAGLWLLAQLGHHALQALDAIARALYRMGVSHRNLLQWATAASVHANASARLCAIARAHWQTTVSMLLLGAVFVRYGAYPQWAALLFGVWAASPVWTWWVSRALKPAKSALLGAQDRAYLSDVARDTWRFFERTITAQDHHLPVDNLQVLPQDMLAHRTSPTNIGLYLLSVACAREFAWIGTLDMLERLEATLATLRTLPRQHGHFFNWYDTQTCEPLLPQYISTVDSGNLSSHLLCVAQACWQRSQTPWDSAALGQPRLLATAAPSSPASPLLHALRNARVRLQPYLARRSQLSAHERAQLRWLLADHRATLRSAQRDQAAGVVQQAHAVQRLKSMAQQLEALAWQPDFSFLYNPKRKLFHIGYRVAEQQRDASYYDLLASESRLTSLLAIAKGDVPVAHWSALSRMSYALRARAGMRSWSGSMFEYLMPSLVLHEPAGSALSDAAKVAVAEQCAYGAAQQVPWGISECAYAGRDYTLAYQYAPQGVPRLALRRAPPGELVVAPYATLLGAMVWPHAASANLRALERLGARQRYGFYEALDYSRSRQTRAQPFTPVGTFMAHHQGMGIAALTNVLLAQQVQRWGMANPRLEAVASLLQERAPREVSRLYSLPADAPEQPLQKSSAGLARDIRPGTHAIAPTHLLSNGRYSVSLRANGAGASTLGSTAIYRWRDDVLRDAYGCFLYLARSPSTALYSLSQHPAPDSAAQYSATFEADRVGLHCNWDDLRSQTTVWVSPEDDIEFRQVELRNTSDTAMELDLLCAFEPTLAPIQADESHPAFSNLFLQMQWSAQDQALRMHRKPRTEAEPGLHAAHFLAQTDAALQRVWVYTDRQLWQGRHPGAQLHLPAAATTSAPQPSTCDTGLNPVAVLGVRLRIAANANAKITFAIAVSIHGEALSAVVDKYRQTKHIERASLMSATLADIRLRALQMTAESFAAIQSLSTALLFHIAHAPQRRVAGNTPPLFCDRTLLWQYGVAGNQPMVLVTVGVVQGMGLLRSLAQALQLWAWAGVGCEVVVINTEPSSYQMALQAEIQALQDKVSRDSPKGSNVRLHAFRFDALTLPAMATLQALARLHIQADGRPLSHHVQEWLEAHALDFNLRANTPDVLLRTSADGRAPAAEPVRQGTFLPETGEFHFTVHAQMRPARPWINVLANPTFGATVSEAGGGFTWAGNSRLHQLSAWSNEPVADPPGEWLLWQDRKTQAIWSMAPNAWAAAQAHYSVVHGQGYTYIQHQRGPVQTRVTWCVDAHTSTKHIHIHVLNTGYRSQHLRALCLVEWIMGASRGHRSTTHTAWRREPLAGGMLNVLLCSQCAVEEGFGESTAFLSLLQTSTATHGHEDWTCDRREFFNPQGQPVLPDTLGQRCGPSLDPCAALTDNITLAAGQSHELWFTIGHAASPALALQLAIDSTQHSVAQRLAALRQHWDTLLGTSVVSTPDPLFDVLVNRWFLYQALSCRLWAKAGFYQAGGAVGFRDQLQDAMAFAWADPALLRSQIVLCASRQFPEGDVQHWWHEPQGMGVRTHISDDLLWLPHACLHYLRATGDNSVLDQSIPFLEGSAVPEDLQDAYYTPSASTETASLYEHAARSIDRSLRVGIHGLPLMGSGDWNDGMSNVGAQGRGESVWLAFFLCRIVAGFAPLAQARGQGDRALRWQAAAVGWQTALGTHAWDGQWFKRAYFDDGQALGSQFNAECHIDLLAQAWAVLSQAVPLAQQQQAMQSAHTHLVDADAGLIRLLTPPLQTMQPNAGYIQSYPPGVRENGGQYAHAAVWALMAQAQLGHGDLAYQYFTHLSPAHRAEHPRYGDAYGLEPYAMAGDVYTQAPYVGQGGWSWYTGAAGLMHRAAIESIFGLEQTATTLRFRPCLPSHWKQAELSLTRRGQHLHFILLRLPTPSLPTPQAAATHHQAQLLPPNTELTWPLLASGSRFLIPLEGGNHIP